MKVQITKEQFDELYKISETYDTVKLDNFLKLILNTEINLKKNDYIIKKETNGNTFISVIEK